MNEFQKSPIALLENLYVNRHLIYIMTKREIKDSYSGSIIGIFWLFLTPLFMLAVYTFVFISIFKSRWPNSNSNIEFSSILFVGLIVYNFFAESASRAPSLIISNVNYVKKVVFPLEILSFVSVLSALFRASASIFVLLAFLIIFSDGIKFSIFLLPIIWIPLIFLNIGISLILSAIGTYLRDIGQIIGLILTALLFLSPIFYPSTAFPSGYEVILNLNPISFVIEQSRNVIIWGLIPNWTNLFEYYIFCILVLFFGFAFFQKSRKGFADVL